MRHPAYQLIPTDSAVTHELANRRLSSRRSGRLLALLQRGGRHNARTSSKKPGAIKKLARIIAAARAKLISQMFLGLRHRRRFPDSQWPGVDRPYVDNPPR